MAEGGGDANTEPQTAALNIPLPTNPDCEGSWPLPPPDSSVTCTIHIHISSVSIDNRNMSMITILEVSSINDINAHSNDC